MKHFVYLIFSAWLCLSCSKDPFQNAEWQNLKNHHVQFGEGELPWEKEEGLSDFVGFQTSRDDEEPAAEKASDPLLSLAALVSSRSGSGDPLYKINLRYPLSGSVFPPEFVSPTFLWNDPKANLWLVKAEPSRAKFSQGGKLHTRPAQGRNFYALALADKLLPLEMDSLATSELTDIPKHERGTHWTPSDKLWQFIKEISSDNPLTLKFFGFDTLDLKSPVSSGELVLFTSKDSVGAPIFYRDVPIMPSRNQEGKISPLSQSAQRLIQWRLKDVSRRDNKVVMEKIYSCANCHSFSKQGDMMGLDIDGPQSDKGAYAFMPLTDSMVIEREDLISWNYDFKEKPVGKQTLGFLSQVSPSGRYVVTTVNEELFIANFLRKDFIQVFYPTKGILAVYDKETDKISTLPGADDSNFVHCDPVWTPDEKHIVFARAPAKEPYVDNQPMPQYAGAPEETPIQYDLYRIPFNKGKGGGATAIPGASQNGMSNNFPKVSPDGKYIVFVKNKNGQLMRPDGKLWIVPLEGGEARLMNGNTSLMNSWHSFSPNGRWMVFSSKSRSYYTDMFLTHINENGMDSPPLYIPGTKAANRAVNIPEFVNIAYDELKNIEVPAVEHFKYVQKALSLGLKGHHQEAVDQLYKALEAAPNDKKFAAEVYVKLALVTKNTEESIRFAKKAIQLDPEYKDGYLNLGIRLFKLGKEHEAVAVLEEAQKLAPKDPWIMVARSSIYMSSRNSEIADLDKALRILTTANKVSYYKEPSLLKTLARVYSLLGQLDKAKEVAAQALKKSIEQGLNREAKELEYDLKQYKQGVAFGG